jgi:hypothetical protein
MDRPSITLEDAGFVFGAFPEPDGDIAVRWRTRSMDRWYYCGVIRREGSSYTAFTYDGGRIGVARDVSAAMALIRDHNASHVPGA